jgi:RNA recognition motif-containing protein
MAELFVGNLPWSVTEEELLTLFSSFGKVRARSLVVEPATGRSRGFAFLEMDDGAARMALTHANGKPLGGRTLRVAEAQARPAPRRAARPAHDTDTSDADARSEARGRWKRRKRNRSQKTREDAEGGDPED